MPTTRERVDDRGRVQRPCSVWRLLEQRAEDSALRFKYPFELRSGDFGFRSPDTRVTVKAPM